MMVDLPDPEPPTIATLLPAGTVKVRPSSIFCPLMYSKQILSKVMSVSLAVSLTSLALSEDATSGLSFIS